MNTNATTTELTNACRAACAAHIAANNYAMADMIAAGWAFATSRGAGFDDAGYAFRRRVNVAYKTVQRETVRGLRAHLAATEIGGGN